MLFLTLLNAMLILGASWIGMIHVTSWFPLLNVYHEESMSNVRKIFILEYWWIRRIKSQCAGWFLQMNIHFEVFASEYFCHLFHYRHTISRRTLFLNSFNFRHYRSWGCVSLSMENHVCVDCSMHSENKSQFSHEHSVVFHKKLTSHIVKEHVCWFGCLTC